MTGKLPPNCTQIEELLALAPDGGLTAQQAALVDAHLADCPSCRALADDLADLSAALRGMETPAPDLLAAQVMRQIGKPRPARHWRQWAAMAAVFAVVVLGGVTARHWLTAPPPETGVVAPESASDAPLTSADAAMGEVPAPMTIYSGQIDNGEDSDAAPPQNDPVEGMTAAAASDNAGAADYGNDEDALRMPEPAPAPDSVPTPVEAATPRMTALPAPTDGDKRMDADTPPESGELQRQADLPPVAPASAQVRTAALPAATLTAAEAEAVLRMHLGDAAAPIYVGDLPGGEYFRFDCDGRTYAISRDGQTIVQKDTPEAAMIAVWDVEESD